MAAHRSHQGYWLRLSALGLVVTGVVAGGACLDTGSTGDLCHPDEGDPPNDLCCPDNRIPTCKPGETMEKVYCCAPTTDAGSDATADGPIGPMCDGQCVALAPNGWDSPSIVWMGLERDAPPCPETALQLGFEGRSGLVATNQCGSCTCDPPVGTCQLPDSITANAAACANINASTPSTPFDAPAGWDGSCTNNDAVSSGKLCNGVACVQSITIAPPVLIETGCVPHKLPVLTQSEPTWATFARSCRWEPSGSCSSSGRRCAPNAPPGFRYCIYHEGDVECPDIHYGPYSERHVFYGGLADTRSCAPCTCNDPSGGECSTKVSIFGDAACGEAPSYLATIDATKASCHDVIAGTALGSKSASPPVYSPGACAPMGGEPMGSASPVEPRTFCCLPPSVVE